jgi:hypothetical protein
MPDVEGVSVAPLLLASAASWGERNWDPASGAPSPDPEERVGPLAFAAVADILEPGRLGVQPVASAPPDPSLPAALSVTPSLVPPDWAPKPGGKVVVVGDADFGANALTSAVDNGAFLLNLVTWLAGDEAQLGADAQKHETMVWTGLQFALVGLVGVFLAPGAAALAGVVLVIRRRFL